jgi:hypothetical protein
VNINSPILYNKIVKNLLDMKGRAHEMELKGTEVPGHMTLPNLQEIVKMRPSPTTQNDNDDDQDDNQNDINTFTEHLVGPVLGKNEWDDRYKCCEWLSTKFTPSNEAYFYVLLTNSNDLWKMWRGQGWAMDV